MLFDLQSSDQKRLEQWKMRLRHHLDWSSSSKPRDLTELAALYRSREAPGRSNYFADLVLNLSLSGNLKKASLLNYIGTPDATQETQEGQSLSYHFTQNTKPELALIVISNDIVVGFGFRSDTGSEE